MDDEPVFSLMVDWSMLVIFSILKISSFRTLSVSSMLFVSVFSETTSREYCSYVK